MFWYETLSGFQHAVSSNAHNMNYGLLMTNVLLLHMMQEGVSLISKKKTNIFFFRFILKMPQIPLTSVRAFLEMSYLVQASGALRIYTLVDLKALEDERKKFDKRKIHGLLQEESDCMKITKKVSLKNNISITNFSAMYLNFGAKNTQLDILGDFQTMWKASLGCLCMEKHKVDQQ